MKELARLLLLLSLSIFLFQTRSASGQTDQSVGNRKVINRVVPSYPQMARTMNLSGTVRLEALVLANGTVKSVQVKGGSPLLAQAAESAIREWKWEKLDHDSTEFVEFKFNP